MTERFQRLEKLDESWRRRNRRLWRFLILTPYVVFVPLLVYMPFRKTAPGWVAVGLAVLCGALLLGYVVVAGVGIFRVNRDGWRRIKPD